MESDLPAASTEGIEVSFSGNFMPKRFGAGKPKPHEDIASCGCLRCKLSDKANERDDPKAKKK